ncbi:MAG: hypothetical protein IJA85_07740 [Clostridia bacterium]|nr:hypothetical protein [Clostridia bacterium]
MERKFDFYGSMPRDVLNSYLSRAVTHSGLCYETGTFEDDLRMLLHEGAKFIGRAAYFWSRSCEIGKYFRICRERAELAHKADPQLILQACVFECINKQQVTSIPIPAYVFEAFGLTPEERNFNYDAMLYPDGRYVDFWGKDSSVEDILQTETKMWIYYLATAYIDAGYEGIHFGQVCLIGQDDRGDFKNWREVIAKIRAYANEHGRRRYVLFDAHQLGNLRQDTEMFDYNAFPIRLQDVPEIQWECCCEENYLDSLFNEKDGHSRPFIVEFDNWGKMSEDQLGKPQVNNYHAWGYDEITWFTKLSPERRDKFLNYIWDWVNERYPEGWVQMPSRRCLVDKVKSVWESANVEKLNEINKFEHVSYTIDEKGNAHITRWNYSANMPSDNCPFGMGDEDTIAEIFHREI